jgi:hypothetical protein
VKCFFSPSRRNLSMRSKIRRATRSQSDEQTREHYERRRKCTPMRYNLRKENANDPARTVSSARIVRYVSIRDPIDLSSIIYYFSCARTKLPPTPLPSHAGAAANPTQPWRLPCAPTAPRPPPLSLTALARDCCRLPTQPWHHGWCRLTL